MSMIEKDKCVCCNSNTTVIEFTGFGKICEHCFFATTETMRSEYNRGINNDTRII